MLMITTAQMKALEADRLARFRCRLHEWLIAKIDEREGVQISDPAADEIVEATLEKCAEYGIEGEVDVAGFAWRCWSLGLEWEKAPERDYALGILTRTDIQGAEKLPMIRRVEKQHRFARQAK